MIAALARPVVSEHDFDLIVQTCLVCGAVGFAMVVIGLCVIWWRRFGRRDDLMDVADTVQDVGPDRERIP